MANFPAALDISNATTEGILKQAHEDTLSAVKQLPGAAPATTLTISVGSITPIQYAHAIDTEAAAAADDLTHLDTTNIPDGQQVLLHTVDLARVITIKHAATGIGDITLVNGLDFILDDIDKRLLLERRGNTWKEICRSYANDQVAARAFAGLTIGTDVLSPTGDGSGLTGIVSGATTAEKSQIAQNSFLIYAQNALAGSNTANGWVDVFADQTGVNTVNSLNLTYDAANDLYNNLGGYTADVFAGGTPTVSSATTGSAAAVFDGLTADSWYYTGSPAWVKYDLGAGVTKTITKIRMFPGNNTANNRHNAFTLEASNDDITYTMLLSASDTDDGTAPVWKEHLVTNAVAYRYYRLTITSSWGGTAFGLAELEGMESSSPLNMTLISNATTALSTPTSARVFLWEEDVAAITLNTELKAYASRDGGTTWTQITLTKAATLATGQLLTGSVNISSQPAGTSMKYKVETLNAKELRIHGAQLYWS